MFYKKHITLSVVPILIFTNSMNAKDLQSLNTVTVTAQKVEENIQEVPISMTFFDTYSIEDKQIKSVKDIAPYTPNLMLFDNSGGGSFTPTMRGVKARNTLSTAVGMYIDGIPTLNINGFDETLMDIERIEVLKGPQGTLYGKGTIAGAINIITKKPDNEVRGKLGLELGSDNKKEYFFNTSGPIVKDKFYIGVSAKHYEKEGFITNTNGGKIDDRAHAYGKINFRYTPTDHLEFSLLSSILKRDDGDNIVNGKDSEDRVVTSDLDGYDKSETTTHALKIKYDINDYLFESITTNREFKYVNLSNYHFTKNTDFHAKRDDTYTKISQEFKLSHSLDTFKYLVGFYADKDDNKIDYISYYPSATYPTNQDADGDSIGLFIHSEYDINDKISLMSGIRYDKDERELQDTSMRLNLSKSDSAVSPKISLKYQQDQHNMFYATIAKGYISGGFNIYSSPGYSKKFDKQTLWNYEVGAKNSFFDHRLFLNSALFYMDISDLQVKTSPEPGKSYISNAAEATSKGFELELNAKVTQSLELFASYGYTNIAFDKFEDVNGNYKGNQNSYAPKQLIIAVCAKALVESIDIIKNLRNIK
ncbi:MAG: TonB-dependent receptor [Epsilonproteobacteria bacterium]|nr:TonB-dependent receptor [Campylobacterota bacterium]